MFLKVKAGLLCAYPTGDEKLTIVNAKLRRNTLEKSFNCVS